MKFESIAALDAYFRKHPRLTRLDLTDWEFKQLPLIVPSSLTRMRIDSAKLKSLPSLPSTLLEGLTVDNCGELTVLRVQRLTSLRYLRVENCAKLRGISALPDSLEELWVDNCPELEIASSTPLPSSLARLVVVNCPKFTTSLTCGWQAEARAS